MNRLAKKLVKMIFLCCFLSCLCLIGIPSKTEAKGFFEHQNTIIPENQTVRELVVVGGDATISGKVENSVIVFNGNLIIHSTAHIKGMVLVIGGTITQAPGAVIKDDVLSITLDNSTQNSLLIGSGLLLGTWMLQFIGSILFIFLPVLFVVFFKPRITPFVHMITQSPGRLMSIGFFGSLIILALSFLLLISLIGIPFLWFFILFITLSFLLGLTALSVLIGEQLQTIMPGKAFWFTTGIGATSIIAVMNIPILGFVLILGMTWFSLGMVTLWTFEKINKRRKAKRA